jgi:hypothetical protein
MKKKAKFRRLQNGIGIASGLAIVGILLLLAFDPGSLPGVPSPALTTSSPSITSGTTTTPNTNGTLPSGISTTPSSTAAPTSSSIGSPKPPTNNKNATGTHSNTAATTPTAISTRSQLSGATTSTTTITTTDPSPSGASAPTTTTTQPPGVAVSTTTTAPTTTTTPTTTPASPSSSTVTEVFAPWTTGGELAPGIQVAANLNDGSCSTASLADGANQNAWRCSSGKNVYDPCFAPPDETNVTQVACAQSPLSAVEMLTLATPLPSSSTAPSSSTGSTPVPWFMQLANGDTCGRTTGTAFSAGSPSPSYDCQSGVASALNTSTEPWTVEYLPNNSDVSSAVAVSTAWN